MNNLENSLKNKKINTIKIFEKKLDVFQRIKTINEKLYYDYIILNKINSQKSLKLNEYINKLITKKKVLINSNKIKKPYKIIKNNKLNIDINNSISVNKKININKNEKIKDKNNLSKKIETKYIYLKNNKGKSVKNYKIKNIKDENFNTIENNRTNVAYNFEIEKMNSNRTKIRNNNITNNNYNLKCKKPKKYEIIYKIKTENIYDKNLLNKSSNEDYYKNI